MLAPEPLAQDEGILCADGQDQAEPHQEAGNKSACHFSD
jgi:hypothetical protein